MVTTTPVAVLRMPAALLCAILLSAALASAQADVVADPTKTRESKGRPAGETSEAGNETKPGGQRRGGAFEAFGDRIQGRYVQAELDLPSCGVRAYAAYGINLLDTVRLNATGCELGRGATKSRVEIRHASSSITLVDAPTALVRFDLRDNTSLELRGGPNASIVGQPPRVSIEAGNLSASLLLARPHDGTALRIDGAVVHVDGSDGNLVVHPLAGHTPERRAIRDAIAQGRAGGQVDFLPSETGPTSEVLAFDDVDIHAARPQADRLDVVVSATLSSGRVFFANVDPGAWDPPRVRVDYADVEDDDRRPARIRPADGLDEVLSFEPGSDPSYFAFTDDEGLHVAVAVPEFSVHAFQVVGLPLEVVPLLMYGVIIVGLFFATGGVGVLLERWRGRKS